MAVGDRPPRTPGPGGFVPWSMGMSLPQMYANASGVERMQTMLAQAFQDYLSSQPGSMALLGRSGVSTPTAAGITGANLQSPAPSYMAAPLSGALAENRLQTEMYGPLMDALQQRLAEASHLSMGERLGSGGILPLLGLALGGIGIPGLFAGGVGAAGVGTSAGGMLGQILGGRY